MKVEITNPQLKAMNDLLDDIEGMLGCAYNECGENTDEIWSRKLKLIDRFFVKNNIDRDKLRR